jgi:hypothetical protein
MGPNQHRQSGFGKKRVALSTESPDLTIFGRSRVLLPRCREILGLLLQQHQARFTFGFQHFPAHQYSGMWNIEAPRILPLAALSALSSHLNAYIGQRGTNRATSAAPYSSIERFYGGRERRAILKIEIDTGFDDRTRRSSSSSSRNASRKRRPP